MKIHWQKGTKYYKLFLQQNLFGGRDIIRCWGQVGTKLGDYKIIPNNTKEELENIIPSIFKRRKYRGYDVASQDLTDELWVKLQKRGKSELRAPILIIFL